MASPYGQKVKRGQFVTLLRQEHDIWTIRTPDELQALRDADTKAGRWCDDGGEPILYGPYNGWPENLMELTLTVTTCRPDWLGYRKRPKGLREGYSTTLQRVVLFRSE